MNAGTAVYGWLMLGAVLLSLGLWWRRFRGDQRMLVIYVGALGGAFAGAKLVYLGAEGWMHWSDPDRWRVLATGKSITGALLGGYAGVELAKRLVKYQQPTGDSFAVIAALGIMLGRLGCMAHGCCLGRVCGLSLPSSLDPTAEGRWPAALAELVFNALMLALLFVLSRQRRLTAQHFHIYLMAYGAFRFGHEFVRDTPRLAWSLSGYHLAAVAIGVLGAIGFLLRQRERRSSSTAPAV